ncbi:hypothetical protein CWB99_16130 [Pseudoalteromonas rubra]|uniref:Uncharacterized protein n=1 Tax=Pseudoalteromonas rubra TaxID=43658 RepID=A0A5S3WK39_9GAMM|nr:hypothetical protein [Pseudoalteromonas rubra]TMP27039.1 hypothetical protein CWB99_16130 [Pseudoalteromonas rubra]TMP36196.1 hypothetical protein CWC00_02975 [Pseudoalteromonas rubra]
MTRQVPSQQWQLSHLRYRQLPAAQHAPSDGLIFGHAYQQSASARGANQPLEVAEYVQTMCNGGVL